MTGINDLSAAWRNAADDLGIEVVAPYSLNNVEGAKLEVPALVKRFGGRKGTVVDVCFNPVAGEQLVESLRKEGYFYSLINPEVYSPYERSVFIEALIDWGWTDSEADPPEWYREAVNKYLRQQGSK